MSRLSDLGRLILARPGALSASSVPDAPSGTGAVRRTLASSLTLFTVVRLEAAA
ncbi:MAG: hypothetical protein MUE60_13455 [Candidatus Eisenbacteria bacterium]|nr:hypothetical protein [Candidatus Eisenbacteria bacterium]